MHDFIETIASNKELALAVGAVLGCIVTCILPVLKTRLFAIVGTVIDSIWLLWMLFSAQVALEIFLLMQWIHGYNSIADPHNVWNVYSYLPLPLVIPLFVANLLVGAGTIARMVKIAPG